MQLIICDDDKLFIQKLQHCLQLFFRQHHLASPQIITFTNGEELLSYTGGIDILFLDIEMPGANGIYIGNILKERNKNIIIFVVTSYSEYLVSKYCLGNKRRNPDSSCKRYYFF